MNSEKILADGQDRIWAETSHRLRTKLNRRCAPLIRKASFFGKFIIHSRIDRFIRRQLKKRAPREALYLQPQSPAGVRRC